MRVSGLVTKATYGQEQTLNNSSSKTKQMDTNEFEAFVHRGLFGQLNLDEVPPSICDIPPLSPEQTKVWHQLYHFLMDADLRNEDAQYEEMARKNILKMLATLRARTQDS